MTLISIIIPIYNCEKTIFRAIHSIIIQSYPNWELILVNDGSTDKSPKKIESFSSNPKIKILHQENQGVSKARNAGAAMAKGKWLLFLDSDDALTAEAFRYIVTGVSENPSAKVILGGFRKIYHGEETISIPSPLKPQATLSGSFAILRSFFQQMGGYDQHLLFSENTELFHRIFLENVHIEYVQKVILEYHESEIGGSKNLKNKIDSLTHILQKHEKTLSAHVKHLYHQIIGVNYIRIRAFESARYHLEKAVYFKPLQLVTWGRLVLAYLPFLACRVYSKYETNA